MKIIGIFFVLFLAITTAKFFDDEAQNYAEHKSWFKKEKDKFDRKKEEWFKKKKEKHAKTNEASYEDSEEKLSLSSKLHNLFNFDFWKWDNIHNGKIVRKIPATPLCPVKINIVRNTTLLPNQFYEASTVLGVFTDTAFHFKTVTITYPVTLFERVKSTYFPDPIVLTETVIAPLVTTITNLLPKTVAKFITETAVKISTFTLTRYVTSTNYIPIYDTLTEYGTVVIASTSAYYSTITEWHSQTVTYTQPVSITTKLYIEAPQLSIITSTTTHPHYMTTTEDIIATVYETVCNKYKKSKSGTGAEKPEGNNKYYKNANINHGSNLNSKAKTKGNAINKQNNYDNLNIK